MNRIIRAAAIASIAAAAAPAVASGHVTLQPAEVPAGEFKRLDVRVPNERDDASTTKVRVKFPPGFIFVSHEAVAGWDAKVTMAKLATPVEVFGEKRTEQVDTVEFSTDGNGIAPGQFQDFGLSVGLPDKPGTTLTFRATQTYSSGEVVRWIGAPDADEPAPQVKLLAAETAEAARRYPGRRRGGRGNGRAGDHRARRRGHRPDRRGSRPGRGAPGPGHVRLRHLRTLIGTCALVFALHGEASAHAVLEHSTPHRNSAVRVAPASVQLDFNEPIEVGFGAVRVYDEQGARVDRGKVSHPEDRSESVVIGLRAGLGRGAYTATYRVVSADGHPVSGGFVFGVGARADVARATPKVADLLARSAAGATVEGGYGAARGLHYAALLILVGAVFFGWLVWPGHGVRLPRRLLTVVALTGLVASLAGVVFQGALGAGLSLGDALDREVIDASLDTRTGEAWLVRAVLWAVVLAGLAVARAAIAWLGVTAAALVATLPYAGHASTSHRAGCLSSPTSCTYWPRGPGWAVWSCCWPASGRGARPARSTARRRRRPSSRAWPCRRSWCSWWPARRKRGSCSDPWGTCCTGPTASR